MYALNENQLIYGNEIARIKSSGRLKIPDEFRKILFKNSRSHNLVLRIGATQNCLEVCDLSSDKVQFFNGKKETKTQSIDKMRYRFSSITEIGMDDRISIPAFFRAQVQLDDYVIFLGTGNGFEIWNPSLLLADEECGPFFKTLISHYVALGHLPESIMTQSEPEADIEVKELGDFSIGSSVCECGASSDGDDGECICETGLDDYLTTSEDDQEASDHDGVGSYTTAETVHLEEAAFEEVDQDMQIDQDMQPEQSVELEPFEQGLQSHQSEQDMQLVEAEQDSNKIPIGALTWPRRGKKLVYSAGFETMLGLAKQVDYITPIMQLETSEWVIVVHPQGMFSEKCVRPMWRARIAEEEKDGETQTSFPTDWRDYSEWSGYDSHNNQTRGLPKELCEHFRAYKSLINAHLLNTSKHGIGPLVANLGALIGAGSGRLDDEVSAQTIN